MVLSLRRVVWLGLGALAPLALFSTPAAAQADPADALDTPEIINSMFECRDIEDDAERLACFDREVGRVYEAQESKDLVIADRKQVREARRGLFGLRLPNLGGIFGGGDDDEEDEIKEITSTIKSVRRMSNGRYFFVLEDGARWMQTETPRLANYDVGDTIVIKRASLGSFMAKVNGGRAVRVKRVN
jgi:hypothetical protein